jgi:hypothetical protein
LYTNRVQTESNDRIADATSQPASRNNQSQINQTQGMSIADSSGGFWPGPTGEPRQWHNYLKRRNLKPLQYHSRAHLDCNCENKATISVHEVNYRDSKKIEEMRTRDLKSWRRETLESFQPLPKRGKLSTIKNPESVKSFNNSTYLQREREASQIEVQDSVWETYDQKGPWRNFRGSKLTQIDNKTFFQRDYDSNTKKLAKTNSKGKSQTGTSRYSHFFSKSQSNHKHASQMNSREILFDKPDIYRTLKTDNKKTLESQPSLKKGFTQSQVLPGLSTVNVSGKFDPNSGQNISKVKND